MDLKSIIAILLSTLLRLLPIATQPFRRLLADTLSERTGLVNS